MSENWTAPFQRNLLPVRSEITRTTTVVKYVARPMGRLCENGPHLLDLRRFVEACEGLPDDVPVQVEKGYTSEAGRYDVTMLVRYEHPDDKGPAEPTGMRS